MQSPVLLQLPGAQSAGRDPPSERMFSCFQQTAQVKVNSLYPSGVELVQSWVSGFESTTPFQWTLTPGKEAGWGSPLKVWRSPSPSSVVGFSSKNFLESVFKLLSENFQINQQIP